MQPSRARNIMTLHLLLLSIKANHQYKSLICFAAAYPSEGQMSIVPMCTDKFITFNLSFMNLIELCLNFWVTIWKSFWNASENMLQGRPKIGLVYHTLPLETLCENVRKQGIMDHFIILLLLTDIFNPYWHELWKQEKCSSLAPPRGISNKTQLACQGVKLTQLMSIFTSKKVWTFLIKIQLTKCDPKRTRGRKVPSLVPIRVNTKYLEVSWLGWASGYS